MQRVHHNIASQKRDKTRVWREQLELLQDRSHLLCPEDRLLVKLYVQTGDSIRQIAHLLGQNRATVARRIGKIVRRLADQQYLSCVQNRDRLTHRQLKLARDYFLRGLSLRELTSKHNMTYHQVRTHIQVLKKINNRAQRQVKIRSY